MPRKIPNKSRSDSDEDGSRRVVAKRQTAAATARRIRAIHAQGVIDSGGPQASVKLYQTPAKLIGYFNTILEFPGAFAARYGRQQRAVSAAVANKSIASFQRPRKMQTAIAAIAIVNMRGAS